MHREIKLKSEISVHTYQILVYVHILCSQRVWALDVTGKSVPRTKQAFPETRKPKCMK